MQDLNLSQIILPLSNPTARLGGHGMHTHNVLPEYQPKYHIYSTWLKTYIEYHRHACVQVTTGNVEKSRSYKGIE